MTAKQDNPPSGSEPGRDSGTDVTGRDRMAWNVMANWAAHFVLIVAGFVLPRMIDRYKGEEVLGTWDFAWALVAYFSLVQLGIVSAVGRYVSRHRAVGETHRINGVVSSAQCVFLVMGGLVAGMTLTATFVIPSLLGDQLGEHVRDAQWAVFLLGASICIQIVFSAFGGVVTGCHRWDLHSAIHAGSRVLGTGAMVLALVLGGGLPQLALMYFLGEAINRVARCVVAYRICPGLSVRPSFVRWSIVRQLIGFGGKSFLFTVANLLLNQTTSLLVVGYLGLSALAHYSRPRALCRHAMTMVAQYSCVLTPSASSLQARSELDALRDLLIKGARYAAYILLPVILVLTIMGDPILGLWMGARYERGLVLAILAISLIGEMQRPCLSVVTGMNVHGPVALVNLGAAVSCIGLTILALGRFNAGLVGAAAALTIPLAMANGIFLPIYACRKTGTSIKQYLVGSLRGPALCVLPFALCLAICRVVFLDRPLVGLASGMGTGLAVLCPVYWKHVVPASLKRRISRPFMRRRGTSQDAADGPAPENPGADLTCSLEQGETVDKV